MVVWRGKERDGTVERVGRRQWLTRKGNDSEWGEGVLEAIVQVSEHLIRTGPARRMSPWA